MILHVCYDNSCIDLETQVNLLKLDFPELTINSYNENLYKERKQSFRIKGGYSARMTPFMLLLDDEKRYLKAFYSEDNTCNIENLKIFLNTYGSKSN